MRQIFSKHGIGHSILSEAFKYHGFEVMMKPSKFLSIAAPFIPKSDYYLRTKLRTKKTLGIPYLRIELDDDWFDGDFSVPAKCVSHEGRNRMYTVKNMYGDRHHAVFLLFEHPIEDISITMLKEIKVNIHSQSSSDNHFCVTGSNFRIQL